MDRREIKQAIRDAMRLDPGLIGNRERERFVNDTCRKLAALGVWEMAYAADVSASPAALPATFSSPVEARWDGRRLQLIDRSKVPSTIPKGAPVYYWVAIDPADGAFKLYTYPEINALGKLTVEYISKFVRIPTDETEDGSGADSHDLSQYGVPEAWHSVVVDGAIAAAHMKNGNHLASREYQKAHDEMRQLLYVQAIEQMNSRPTEDEPDGGLSLTDLNIFIPPKY